MNRQNVESFKMLTRIVDFIARNVSWFPKTTAVAEILKALKSGVEKLTEAAATTKSEEASMREARTTRVSARKNLRSLISRASLVSRALHSETVRPPQKGSEHELIAIGRGFAGNAEALKKDFVRLALPPEDVLGAVETLEGAIAAYTTARTARSAAIKEWNKALAETMEALIGLDALVANTLTDNPVALASYETLRTIPRTRGRARRAKIPSVAVTPAVPPPVVTPESPPAPAHVPAAATTATAA
jgi:hypothetical protein